MGHMRRGESLDGREKVVKVESPKREREKTPPPKRDRRPSVKAAGSGQGPPALAQPKSESSREETASR